jgi:serine-threonine kinase receptor-associated protein
MKLLFFLDPFIISGQTSGLRHIAFLGKGEKIVSCADDRTVRFWERSTGKVQTI